MLIFADFINVDLKMKISAQVHFFFKIRKFDLRVSNTVKFPTIIEKT